MARYHILDLLFEPIFGTGTLLRGLQILALQLLLLSQSCADIKSLSAGRYFVTSDVGEGRIQWYAFLALPAGTRKARLQGG